MDVWQGIRRSLSLVIRQVDRKKVFIKGKQPSDGEMDVGSLFTGLCFIELFGYVIIIFSKTLGVS